MYSKDDILAKLRKGADASVIAQEMADNINAALQEYQEEQKAEEIKKIKRQDARKVIDAMSEFFGKYFGEVMPEAEREQAVDAMIELTDHIRDMESHLKDLVKAVEKNDQAPSAENEIDDETLRRFLKSLG